MHSGWAGVCDTCGSSIWADLAEETVTDLTEEELAGYEAALVPPRLIAALRAKNEQAEMWRIGAQRIATERDELRAEVERLRAEINERDRIVARAFRVDL